MNDEPTPLRAAFDPDAFRRTGHAFIDALADYLARAMAGPPLPVLPPTPPGALLAQTPAAQTPRDALDTLREVLERSNHLHHPRYVGHQVTPTLPTAALFELVAAVLNNSMAVYEMGPLATTMERRLLEWMAQHAGLPDTSSGVLTSGGSAGNLTALLAARQARAGFEVWREGAHAGPPLCVLASADAHYSVKRAMCVLGYGEDGVVPVPIDERRKLRVDALPAAKAEAEARGRRVFAVVASAGATPTGSFDPLDAIADFCAAHALWMHVDGAHGASAALSPTHRELVAGLERADSVVWDAHKMMLMPALVTAVLFRDGQASYGTFAQQASYLFGAHGEDAQGPWWDVGMRTLECTKRMLSLPLYASLAAHGAQPFVEHIDTTFGLARRFHALLADAPDFEAPVPPECNIVCFRYRPVGFPEAQLSALQERLRAAVLAEGTFYLVQTRLDDALYLRTTLMNPLTSDADLAALMERLRVVARGLLDR